jgi:chromate transporter
LPAIAGEWLRIGVIGFGGPPAHISLLRKLCVVRKKWMTPDEFEDAISAVNILPGPASTQLAIFCAWLLRGTVGALIGGACFIVPGLLVILGLSAVFLQTTPPVAVLGAAAGAGAAVPAVALRAAIDLVPSSWRRQPGSLSSHIPWLIYVAAGVAVAVEAGPFVVLVLLACGISEVVRSRIVERRSSPQEQGSTGAGSAGLVFALTRGKAAAAAGVATGGLLAVCYVAFKVGALSYGGGFVIVPLMQHDAVTTFHWMTGQQFLGAVALGQITPGPVVLTVAVVGYAAGGVPAALLATVVAFAPSFTFVIAGARSFGRIRNNRNAQSFLSGSGPAAIGAIAGASVALSAEIAHVWQIGVLAFAVVYLLAARGNVVVTLAVAALAGVLAGVAGAPVH